MPLARLFAFALVLVVAVAQLEEPADLQSNEFANIPEIDALLSALWTTSQQNGTTPSLQADSAAATPFAWTRVATGLNNPRQLAFGVSKADYDDLYIAEAGMGSGATVDQSSACTQDGANKVCFGLTASVSRVNLRTAHQDRIVTGLPSVAVSAPDANDHTTVTGSRAFGLQSISTEVPHKLRRVLSVDEEAIESPLVFALSGHWAPQLKAQGADFSFYGKVIQLIRKSDGTFTTSVVADPTGFNLGAGAAQSNPVSIVTARHQLTGDLYHVVADAASNNVLVCQQRGACNVFAAFANRPATVPELNNAMFPAVQSVPTALLAFPNGRVLVGELTGNPFVQNFARILGLDSSYTDHQKKLADGFTCISAMTVDDYGNTYVLEIVSAGLRAGPSVGDTRAGLVVIARDGSKKRVLPCEATNTDCEDLHFAYGIAYRRGTLYVSHKSTLPAVGEVVALPLKKLKKY